MVTTIGIDPHKATHTAVAIDATETVLGELTVPADRYQINRLVDWACRLDGDGRLWAVEAAGGLGYLLSQQLVARGEPVVDVPAVLASRVRVLSSGHSDKNDPNDARSVAIAALRQPGLAVVKREDHIQVLRMLAKRHMELTSLRTQAVCRLHAVLVLLRPGGLPKRVSAKRASQLLRNLRNLNYVSEQRRRAVRTHLADIRRLDRDIKANKALMRRAITVSETTVTEVYGVGPIVAAFLIGYTGDPARFASPDKYAAYNGPPPSKCPPVANPPSAIATREPDPQPCHPHGSSHPDPVRHPRPQLLRQETRRGQNEKGSTPRVETPRLRRCVSTTRS